MRASGLRSESTGPSTSGITSPAFRTMTVSPTRTSLRCTSSRLCSVARATVEPATTTGIQLRHRRERAGAPHLHGDVAQKRRLLLGRELERDGPARRAGGKSHGSLAARTSFTFTTTPSIS